MDTDYKFSEDEVGFKPKPPMAHFLWHTSSCTANFTQSKTKDIFKNLLAET